MTQEIDFTVTGEPKIHCAGCEQRISNALRRLLGVKDVQASAESQRVVVRFNPTRVMPEDVRAKLQQLGYHVLPGPDRGGARPLRRTGEDGMRGPASGRSSL